MNADSVPWIDGALFNENQNKYPPEELEKYAGQQVAWSLDGTRILASGKDHDMLLAQLVALDLDPQRVVWSYVPSEDEVTWL